MHLRWGVFSNNVAHPVKLGEKSIKSSHINWPDGKVAPSTWLEDTHQKPAHLIFKHVVSHLTELDSSLWSSSSRRSNSNGHRWIIGCCNGFTICVLQIQSYEGFTDCHVYRSLWNVATFSQEMLALDQTPLCPVVTVVIGYFLCRSSLIEEDL